MNWAALNVWYFVTFLAGVISGMVIALKLKG